MKKQDYKDRLAEAEGKKKSMMKKKQTTKDRLDEAEPKRKKKTHRMKDGTLHTGATHTKDSKPVKEKKMETVKVGKEVIKFKKGGLHDSLKVPDTYKFSKAQIDRYADKPVGSKIRINKNTIEITKKIAKQIDLARTLMGFKKKK